MTFREVAKVDELWVGEMLRVRVDDLPVLLLRTDQGFFAYEDRCAHLGLPLSTGKLVRGVLVCREHLYEYDAETGCGINPRCVKLRGFPTRLLDGAVLVDPAPDHEEVNS
jgi:toluene monooxygenase system ferredoxin subunit